MTSTPHDRLIHVSAVVIRNAQGLVLTVRKRGTHRFMLPGGKPEAGESPRQTAVREVAEELGVLLEESNLTDVGVFTAPAANEDGFRAHAHVYSHDTVLVDAPAAEIEELRWLDVSGATLPQDLAPLLEHHVIPALATR